MKHNADAYSLDSAQGGALPLKLELRQPKRSWLSMFGWLVVVAVLGLSWHSADMRPLDLFSDSGNMLQFGKDFFRRISLTGAPTFTR